MIEPHLQGSRKDKSPVREGRSDPDAVLTYDLGQDETNFFSLGFKFDEEGNPLEKGGWVIVEFDCPIKNGEGDDIMIVEDTWGSYPLEAAKVYVSQDGEKWLYLGVADNTERTVNNIHTESFFDLDDVELEWVKFVKVVDVTPISDMPDDGDGFDLNTIVALHDCYECITYDETAWGDGTRFVQRGNWATYFTYTICCDFGNGCYDWTNEETGWAANGDVAGVFRYEESGNWATYVEYAEKTTTLFAGQTIDAGNVTFSGPSDGNITITIVLTGDWKFRPVAENVKIQDYQNAPSGNPAPGGFDHKFTVNYTETTAEFVVPRNYLYGVHVDLAKNVSEIECP